MSFAAGFLAGLWTCLAVAFALLVLMAWAKGIRLDPQGCQHVTARVDGCDCCEGICPCSMDCPQGPTS